MTGTVDILDKLIAMPTVSSDSNLDLIHWVRDYLSGYGIDSRLTFGEEPGKANLWATIGPADKPGGIVLSGHTDVVPVAGQNWTGDPFVMDQRDGKLYGRGTCDMKGFIAAVLAKVPAWSQQRFETPLHLAFSFDEEVSCFGVTHLINDVVANLPLPKAVIIGEPTSMKVMNAHKGNAGMMCTVKGTAGHSSMPHKGVNAIYAAGKLISHIQDLQEELAKTPSATPFDPPYSTFNVGMIEGGAGANIIAEWCSFPVEVRVVPEHDAPDLLAKVKEYAKTVLEPQMKAMVPEAGFTFTDGHDTPPLRPEEDSVAEEIIRKLTGENQTVSGAFCTEGGHFQAVGMSTVIFGPGSIEQAHQPDEFISLDQLAACDTFLNALGCWARAAD